MLEINVSPINTIRIVPMIPRKTPILLIRILFPISILYVVLKCWVTVSYNRQLLLNLAIIFDLARTLAIPSGFGRSRIRRNCGYTLLGNVFYSVPLNFSYLAFISCSTPVLFPNPRIFFNVSIHCGCNPPLQTIFGISFSNIKTPRW